MTKAPEVPLHMRRDAFSPVAELREIRETEGVRTVTNAFGMQVRLITRHEDIKNVLSDHERFSNGRPPGFVVPGAPQVSEEEQASSRAGNLLGLDPPEHSRLRRMLTPEFTIRRMKRLEPRITEMAWPTKIVFGVGALQRLPAQVARLGMKKPLVVTDAGVVKAGLAQRVYDVLRGADIAYGVFDRVQPNLDDNTFAFSVLLG